MPAAGREPDLRFDVSPALHGQRVDRAVALVTGWTRADVAALCGAGSITVSGASVAKGHHVSAGDVVEAWDVPALTRPPEPDGGVPVPVAYEDAYVVVVDKPAGVVVHPGAGNLHGTLVNGLLARYPEIAGVGEPERPGIVHRLDRDTSGLMVVARTEAARAALATALAHREVGRRYLALVHGVPANARGVVDAPIGRSVRRPTRQAVRAGGRESRTRYERREAFPAVPAALLECTLETGRTHQIRVHLDAIGHGVAGDPFYGPGTPAQGPLAGLGRPFLHVAHLAFAHPVTGELLELASPLPEPLASLLETLRSDR